MDMNRKSRLDLKNKKTKMAASLIQKFVLVLALFVMVPDFGYAGSYNPFLTEFDVVKTTTTLNDGRTFNIKNQANTNTKDDWKDDPYFGFTGEAYRGYYLGSFNSQSNSKGGLDSKEVLSELIEQYLGGNSINIGEFYRVENTNTNSDLTVTYNKPNDNSGEWKVTNNNSSENEYKISFYSVMGGNEFALYFVDPAQSGGAWTTAHLKAGGAKGKSNAQPGISHMSVYVSKSSDLSNVPEPATMLLFGFSLIGLAGMARRRNSKF